MKCSICNFLFIPNELDKFNKNCYMYKIHCRCKGYHNSRFIKRCNVVINIRTNEYIYYNFPFIEEKNIFYLEGSLHYDDTSLFKIDKNDDDILIFSTKFIFLNREDSFTNVKSTFYRMKKLSVFC